jgi:hypothetical protein
MVRAARDPGTGGPFTPTSPLGVRGKGDSCETAESPPHTRSRRVAQSTARVAVEGASVAQRHAADSGAALDEHHMNGDVPMKAQYAAGWFLTAAILPLRDRRPSACDSAGRRGRPAEGGGPCAAGRRQTCVPP